jgi:hypothetical protein
VKKTLSLIAMAIIVAALAVVYLRSSRDGGEYEPQETLPPVPERFILSDREQSEIAKIYVTNGEDTRLFLPGEEWLDRFVWYLADQPDLLMDNALVQNLLRAAFNLQATDKIHEDTSGLDLAEFGFDPPTAVISAHYHNGGVATIRLGSDTPDFRHYFVTVDGDPAMYIIPRNFGGLMLLQTEDLIARGVPVIPTNMITHLRLQQREREAFEFIDGIALSPAAIAGQTIDLFNLHHYALEEFFNGFRLGAIREMFPEDLTPFGLDDPFIELFIESESETVHLLFGDRNENEIYVKFADRPHVFTAQFAPVNHITDVNLILFLTRFLALIPIVELERAEIVHVNPERNLSLVINNDPAENSNAISPTLNGASVPEQEFRALYRTLIAIGPDSVLEPFRAEEAPEFTLTFYLLDGTKKTIEFFDFDANFLSFSIDGDYVWAVTNRRGVEMFFTEAIRLLP